MSIDYIQIVADATIETDESGKKDILLNIESSDLLFDGDNVNLTVVLNGVILGGWQ